MRCLAGNHFLECDFWLRLKTTNRPFVLRNWSHTGYPPQKKYLPRGIRMTWCLGCLVDNLFLNPKNRTINGKIHLRIRTSSQPLTNKTCWSGWYPGLGPWPFLTLKKCVWWSSFYQGKTKAVSKNILIQSLQMTWHIHGPNCSMLSHYHTNLYKQNIINIHQWSTRL